VRYDPIPFTRAAVETWAKGALAASAEVVSDGLACFGGVIASGASHSYYVTSGRGGKAAAQHPAFRAVNTLLGNLKTSLAGTYHDFDFRKYAHRYLADAQYRFNRRFNLKSILARLVHAAAITGPSSLSDFGIVGCKSTAAVHFSPAFCPIAGLCGGKSEKTGLAGADFRYRRSKSDWLLGPNP